MSLSNFLKKQGYDLIDGPVRNHQPLQLWLKRAFNETQLYYKHINYAFKSEVALREIENPAMQVDAAQKDEFSFNIGMTFLGQLIEAIGLGEFLLEAQLKSGKRVSIGYDHSFSREYALGNLENYFHTADFLHPNPSLLKNANHNNLLIISGVLFAQRIVVDIETDFAVETDLIAELNESAKGDLSFTKKANDHIEMISEGKRTFPIAVKANKIDFDHNTFDRLKLISDNRNFF